MTYVQRVRHFSYYNEINEYAAEWTENLIRMGAIAPGIVDRRSIEDVRPDDLRGFRQCHFFSGIAVWSYAFRRSGITDDVAVWSGSCPCQPFSAAGQGGGMDDERHLWPAWFNLIDKCRPPRIYGEQVASKDGLGWLDLVCTDMERAGYAIGAVDTCSAGSGAPHIRQRLRFFANYPGSPADELGNAFSPRLEGYRGDGDRTGGRSIEAGSVAEANDLDILADTASEGLEERGRFPSQSGWQIIRPERPHLVDILADADSGDAGQWRDPGSAEGPWFQSGSVSYGRGQPGSLADRSGVRREVAIFDTGSGLAADGRRQTDVPRSSGTDSRSCPTNGFWRDADWLFCRDNKWRAVEPGSLPLVNGAAFNVGSGSPLEGKSRKEMLRAYGNAIDAEATVAFIESTLVTIDDVDGGGIVEEDDFLLV